MLAEREFDELAGKPVSNRLISLIYHTFFKEISMLIMGICELAALSYFQRKSKKILFINCMFNIRNKRKKFRYAADSKIKFLHLLCSKFFRYDEYKKRYHPVGVQRGNVGTFQISSWKWK